MSRTIASLRTFAKALQNTVKYLDQDPNFDPNDPASMSLKSSTLGYAAALAEKADLLESGIPVTGLSEPGSQPTVTGPPSPSGVFRTPPAKRQ